MLTSSVCGRAELVRQAAKKGGCENLSSILRTSFHDFTKPRFLPHGVIQGVAVVLSDVGLKELSSVHTVQCSE